MGTLASSSKASGSQMSTPFFFYIEIYNPFFVAAVVVVVVITIITITIDKVI